MEKAGGVMETGGQAETGGKGSGDKSSLVSFGTALLFFFFCLWLEKPGEERHERVSDGATWRVFRVQRSRRVLSSVRSRCSESRRMRKPEPDPLVWLEMAPFNAARPRRSHVSTHVP